MVVRTSQNFQDGQDILMQLPLKVLTKILENCSINDLCTLCLVNSSLKFLSTRALLKNSKIQINLDPKLTDFSRNIQQLISCLENSKKLKLLSQFPCSSFKLHIEHVTCVEIQKFFHLNGQFVESLTIYGNSTQTQFTNHSFKNFIFHKIPNIKILQLKIQAQVALTPNSSLLDSLSAPLILSKLKTLNLCGNYDLEPIFLEILNCTNNLETFQNFGYYRGSSAEIFILNHKPHTIKKVVFRPSRQSLSFYEKVANVSTELQVKNLSFNLKDFYSTDPSLVNSVCAAISETFENSKTTLKKVLFEASESLKGIKISFCENLSKLQLNYFGQSPNDLILIEKLFGAFPNLKNLVISPTMDLGGVCQTIFRGCRKLELLDFRNVRLRSKGNDYPAIEAALTGFSRDTCRKLGALKKIEFIRYSSILKCQSSLTDLKRLKILKIELTAFPLLDKNQWFKPILTNVSALYAFKLMPNLKVAVSANVQGCDIHMRDAAKSALASMEPFVHSTKLII